MKDIKYIIKKVIIGILIAVGVILFKNQVSFAAIVSPSYTISGVNVTNGQSIWVEGSYANIVVNYYGYPDGINGPGDYWQVSLAICRYNVVSGGTVIEGNGPSLTVNNTNYRCYVKNGDNNIKGYVTIVSYGATGGGSYNRVYFRLYQNNYSDYSILGIKIGLDGIINAQDYGFIDDTSDAIDRQTTALTNVMNATTNALNSGFTMLGNWAQQQLQSLNQLENSMKDDNIEENNQQFNEFNSYMANNGVITNLITLPITLYTSVLNSINGTCSTYSLGNLYGSALDLPCIQIEIYLGSALWSTIDIIMSGVLIYLISRHFIKVFNKMSSLEEGDIID